MATPEIATRRGEFTNEPFTNFSLPENRAAMEAALHKVAAELGKDYPLLIGGQPIFTDDKIVSLNPSRPSQIVGNFSKATVELANKAIEEAARYFDHWKRTRPEDRAEILFKTAELLRQRKFEFNAWLTYEVGKTWHEADADIAETIDFCEFYAREALRYFGPQPIIPVPGERNKLVYIPLGVGVVIPPWNFAAAIMAGMTTASLVCGNTVVLKPSSDSPAIAYKFVELLHEAGLPLNALQFCPGPGGSMGDAIVLHPKTRFIAFTGSKEIGLRVCENAAKVSPGQVWIKRYILEMGGKDAIIVDDEADLAAAVEGVAISAFGYQGQKCSACSRAIIHEKIYDQFLEKLIPRVKKIKVGPAEDPSNYMGPVVNKRSMESILNYIEIGKKEGRLLTGGGRVNVSDAPDGYYLEPTVIADVKPGAKIECEEIFGPVLAVIKARDFDHALEIANDTEFGLTGAVYTKNRAKLDRAAAEFHVGNLYLNRKCTGALVGGHPFGGFNMSGTDSKAGGRDYLFLFVQPKSITEKIS